MMLFQGFKYRIPEKVTITVDWFEVFGKTTFPIFKEYSTMTYKEGLDNLIEVTPEMILVVCNYATSTYRTVFEVRYSGHLIGLIYANPRNINERFTEDCVSVKIANNLLYTENWLTQFRVIQKFFAITINNITRLDIAIDGFTDLIQFLTMYTKQNENKKRVIRVGKAQLTPYKFQDETLKYDGFMVGARQSDKYMVIYQKSIELNRSRKDYIKEFWERNGIDSKGYVERAEIRLNSKYLETIGLNIDYLEKLENPTYLASVYFTATLSYFDFRKNNSVNITYCDKIKLIPFEKMNSRYLPKCRAIPPTDVYKTKISIHTQVMEILRGEISGNLIEHKKQVIASHIEKYSLRTWYEDKLPEWKAIYETQKTTGHYYELSQL
ncbi:MAG: replication initiation factor domain-containing protein [Cytophagales bacterium]